MNWLRTLSALVFCVLLLQGVAAFAGQSNVFIYHRFNDDRYPSTNVSEQTFATHLELLQRENFVVLNLGDVVDRLQKGVSLPQRCAVISIDDGYRSFLVSGWPLLKRYGYPATLFVATDAVGKGDYLDWQELRGMQAEGLEIGSHSASHAYLLDRDEGEDEGTWSMRVEEDLKRSQKAFLDNLGTVPQLFAYPYGEFSPQLIALVKRAGFVAAFGQQSGVIAPGQELFSLPRFPMGGGYNAVEEFRRKLFMRPLALSVSSPHTNLITEDNPPSLRFYLQQQEVDGKTLRCYVPGQPDCLVRSVAGEEGLYEAQAQQPLTGRRSKYTLTAQGANGGAWYWYSQFWVVLSEVR